MVENHIAFFKEHILASVDYELKAEKELALAIKDIMTSMGVEYLKFNENTSFPSFYDNVLNEFEAIVGVRVKEDENGSNQLLICVNEVDIDNLNDGAVWFYWRNWGELDMHEVLYCVEQLLNNK